MDGGASLEAVRQDFVRLRPPTAGAGFGAPAILIFVEALRFACQPGCTNCCRVDGYVYLTEEDVRRAAAFLRLSPREFEAKYVYRTRHLIRLRKPRGSQCHFLQPQGCALHPHKPTQCRAYPFWPELLMTSHAWHETARVCPGIGKGGLIPVQAIQRIAEQMMLSYPEIYPPERYSSVPRRTKLAMVK